MDAFTTHTGTAVPLRRSNVDTDQIIPAEYLKRITRTGFEDGLFVAWRTNEPDFVLNQPQYAPWPMEEQVLAIWAGVNGHLDDIPTAQVPRFQDELREYLRAEGSIYKEIREGGDLPEELEGRLKSEVEKFKQNFAVQEESVV